MPAPKFSPGELRSLKARLSELERRKTTEELEFPDFYDHEISALKSALKDDEQT